MFKKRGFNKKKKDVRRRPIERLSFMPQQISTKEEIGKKRGKAPKFYTGAESKFIPYSSASSMVSIPSQKTTYAGKRKGATSLNDVVLSLIMSQQRLPRQVYKDSQSEEVNKKYEELLDTQKSIYEQKLSDAITERDDYKSQIDDRFFRDQMEGVKNVIDTGEGYRYEDEINPITLQSKEEGIISAISRTDDRDKEEILNKFNIMNEKIDAYKKEISNLNKDINESIEDRISDSQLKTTNMINNLRNDVRDMVEMNKKFKESIKPVEEQIVNVIKLEDRPTQVKPQTAEAQTQYKINRGEFGTDPVSEKEYSELKDQETKDTDEYAVYVGMIDDIKNEKQVLENMEKVAGNFEGFIENAKKIQRLNKPTLNAIIDKVNSYYPYLNILQYKIIGGNPQLTPKQTLKFKQEVIPILEGKIGVMEGQFNNKKSQFNTNKLNLENYRKNYGFKKRVIT